MRAGISCPQDNALEQKAKADIKLNYSSKFLIPQISLKVNLNQSIISHPPPVKFAENIGGLR